MTAPWVPVLALHDVKAGLLHLKNRLGFDVVGPETVRLGNQTIQLCPFGAAPQAMVALPLDHVAIRVSSVDETHQSLLKRGARLHSGFTPDGPGTIKEFHQNGIRYVFFQGPEDTPIEFCEHLGTDFAGAGHDHLAIRTRHMAKTQTALAGLGCEPVAEYLLTGPVQVQFLRAGATTFEVFDEISGTAGDTRHGFPGFCPQPDH